MKKIKKYMAIGAGAGALVLAAPMASAASLSLCAGQADMTMSDGATVPMWGYALGATTTAADGSTVCAGTISVPGPEIEVPVGDATLEVTLYNTLDAPVSLIIQGQDLPVPAGAAAPAGPVMNSTGRMRSLVHETAPGASSMYVWSNVKTGSHVYHSATHQQVQVQMGLYGAMVKDADAGVAYSEAHGAVNYHNAVNVFYSEVDPALHARIAATDFAAMTAANNLQLPQSTLDYQPEYSMVNGQGVAADALPDTTGTNGDLLGGTNVLVRMFNAGLKSHYPQSLGARMQVVAQNGFMLRFPQDRVSVGVHPLGTADVIVRAPQAGGDVAIVDRRLHLNDGTASRGMISKLSMAQSMGPLANADAFSVAEDSVNAPLAVLGNDGYQVDVTDVTITIENEPVHGIASVAGSVINYTPHADYFGADSLTYTIVDATGMSSAAATVDITVTPVAEPPVAVADAFTAYAGTVLQIPAPGVLANDFDVDGDALSVSGSTAVAGLTINADGSLTLDTVAAGLAVGNSVTSTYTIVDVDGNAAMADVTISVVAGVPPVAGEDTFSYSRGANTLAPDALGNLVWSSMDIAIATGLLSNDADADNAAFPAGALIGLPFSTVTQTTDIADPTSGNVIGSLVQMTGLTQMAGSLIVLENELDAAGNIVAQTLTYTPPLNGLGTDEFLYQVIDGDGNVSNPAIVRINIVE